MSECIQDIFVDFCKNFKLSRDLRKLIYNTVLATSITCDTKVAALTKKNKAENWEIMKNFFSEVYIIFVKNHKNLMQGNCNRFHVCSGIRGN